MGKGLRVLLEEILEELRKINLGRAPKPRQEKLPLSGGELPQIAHVWNKWAHDSLSKVVSVPESGTRFKNMLCRWREKPNEDYWVGVVRKISASSFCLGKNDRDWKADIDFLIRPDTASKVLEGKYDNPPEEKKKTELVVVSYNSQGDPVYGVRPS